MSDTTDSASPAPEEGATRREADKAKSAYEGDKKLAEGGKPGEESEAEKERKKQEEEDDKHTCCCVFLNFPKLGVWGLIWTFLWPIFALAVMIIFAASFNSDGNCFKPALMAAGLGQVWQVLFALFVIAIIVTAFIFFYDLYLFGRFSDEQPEMYVKARAALTFSGEDFGSLGKDADALKRFAGDAKGGDLEMSARVGVKADTEVKMEKPSVDGKTNPELPTRPMGCFGKMIAYCEWKFFRVKWIPGLSFYHVQGALDLAVSDALALAIVISVCAGMGFINVSGLLVLVKSVVSLLRYIVGDLFCTNCNIIKKTLKCCDAPQFVKKCLDKVCKGPCDSCKNCAKKCSCKKCKDCTESCTRSCKNCKCKMDCCNKDIDCKHFKIRCRNLSCQKQKYKIDKWTKDNVNQKAVQKAVTSSPVCTALSMGLLVSTGILAACCAVHTVGEQSWTLGGGLANIQLNPSVPYVCGNNILTLNFTSIDGVAVVPSSQMVSTPLCLLPFQSMTSQDVSMTFNGTEIMLTKKIFRMASKTYMEIDAVADGSQSRLFLSEISSDVLFCVTTGLPCSFPVMLLLGTGLGRFQVALSDVFDISALQTCSLI